MPSFYSCLQKKSSDLEELELFADICSKALRRATKGVEEIDLWQRISGLLGEKPPMEPGEALEKAKARAATVAAFAEAQKTNGAPYLFSLCTVRLWALLEALVDELVVEAMKDPGSCTDQVLLSKLKGPLVEFKVASSDEQAEFLAETLKQAVDAPLKLGAGRFEAILGPVGLGGEVDDHVRKNLFELSQVRNCVVHKGAKADRRFLEACPWLDIDRGAEIQVTAAMFERYMTAAFWYAVELRGRVDERGGGSRDESVPAALAMLADLLKPSVPADA